MKRIIIMAVVVLLIPIASYGSKREITNYVVTTQVGSTELIDSINIVSTKPLNEEQETMIKELVTRHALENKDLAYTCKMIYAIANVGQAAKETTIKRSFNADIKMPPQVNYFYAPDDTPALVCFMLALVVLCIGLFISLVQERNLRKRTYDRFLQLYCNNMDYRHDIRVLQQKNEHLEQQIRSLEEELESK